MEQLQDENNDPESSKTNKKKKPNDLTETQRTSIMRFLEKKLVSSTQNENFVRVKCLLFRKVVLFFKSFVIS